jgi:hypothetical protein
MEAKLERDVDVRGREDMTARREERGIVGVGRGMIRIVGA